MRGARGRGARLTGLLHPTLQGWRARDSPCRAPIRKGSRGQEGKGITAPSGEERGVREGNPRAYTFIYKNIGWPSLAQGPKAVDPCSTLSPTTGIINLANPGNRLEFHCGFNLFSVITNGVNLLLFALSIPISSVKRSFILARCSN